MSRDWGCLRLCELICGTDSGVWGSPGTPEDGVPVLRSTNISHWQVDLSKDIAYRKISPAKIEKKRLERGDIIVTRSSGSAHLVGEAALFDIDAPETPFLFSNFIQRLRPDKQLVLPEYLHAYLRSPQARQHIERMQSTTSGIRNLKLQEYLNQEVPLPYPDYPQRSLAEQRQIVARLEMMLGEVREMRATIREMRKDVDRLMEAVLEEVFSQDYRGDISTSWGIVTLRDIAEEDSSQILPSDEPEAVFNYWGLDAIQKGQMDEPPPNYVLGAKVRGVCVRFDQRHVLYAKLRPYLNKVIVPSVEGIGSTEWIVLRPKSELVDRKYLGFALRTRKFVEYASASSVGTRMPRARKEAFWAAEIPLPYPDNPQRSLAEQRRIVARLEAIYQEIRAMQESLDQDEQAVNQLEQSILAAAFRGEI